MLPQLRVGEAYAAVSRNHVQKLPMPAFLLPLFIVRCLACAHTSGFHSFSGGLDPLLSGCMTFTAADQTAFIQIFILLELNRIGENLNFLTDRDHKLSPSSQS
jgi:hypothetical protein